MFSEEKIVTCHLHALEKDWVWEDGYEANDWRSCTLGEF